MEVAMFDELSSEDEKKKWLFKENIRLQELSRNLEDERKLIEIQMGMLQRQQSKNMLLKKQLESQRDLFEQKWNILERETRQLAIDKDKFEREKLIYKDKVYREARRSMSNAENVKIFFKGVEDTTSLKKRYKALLKIYHPIICMEIKNFYRQLIQNMKDYQDFILEHNEK